MKQLHKQSIVWLVLLAVIWFVPSNISFGFERTKDSTKLFRQFCMDCHSNSQSEADVNLEALLIDNPIVKNRRSWIRVKQLIQTKAMPPQDYDQPGRGERGQMLAWIEKNIDAFDYSKIRNPGWEQVRRLTHREYNNTIRDLLGVDIQPAAKFPDELVGGTGFDNSANTLFLQPALMERYIAAAERVVETAMPLKREKNEIEPQTLEVVFDSYDVSKIDDRTALRILRKFLNRAFRQPVSESDWNSNQRMYYLPRKQGESVLSSLKRVFAGVLISPSFLMRVESVQKDDEQIDEYELATRLSYFLWSSMPDEELFRLASQSQLRKSETLRTQIQRMLHDPKAEEFAESFAGQWLSTKLVGREIRLDPIDQPWCTDTLMEAMREETKLLFLTIVAENRPITNLINADFTFVNEELATTLYRIKSVRGRKMQRVNLKGQDRKGILGHASVLAVTSNHDETSPIKRGAFVLERILGTPPPPPPPDAGELDEDLAENDDLTFAQKLQRHAADQRCSGCHDTIDPLGIALEKYGAFGRYRTRFSGRRISSTATLADGHELSGATGLREYLLTERREDFIRNFSTRMLEYALGRQTEYFDEPAIRQIISHASQNDLKIQSIIYSIVTSYPFQNRRDQKQ